VRDTVHGTVIKVPQVKGSLGRNQAKGCMTCLFGAFRLSSQKMSHGAHTLLISWKEIPASVKLVNKYLSNVLKETQRWPKQIPSGSVVRQTIMSV
jgi:hypothetical protein